VQKKLGEPRGEKRMQQSEGAPSSSLISLKKKNPRETGVHQNTLQEQCPSQVDDISE